jgi:hypothetical protein
VLPSRREPPGFGTVAVPVKAAACHASVTTPRRPCRGRGHCGCGLCCDPWLGGVVSACYKQGPGELRVIDAEANDRCRPTENSLSWQALPPAGGVAPSVVVRWGGEVIVPVGGNASTTARCEPGDLAVGGGYNSGDLGLFVITSQPIPADGEFARNGETPTGWSFHIANTRSVNLGFLPTVTCLNPAPPSDG